jgi:hypothetical protein
MRVMCTTLRRRRVDDDRSRYIGGLAPACSPGAIGSGVRVLPHLVMSAHGFLLSRSPYEDASWRDARPSFAAPLRRSPGDPRDAALVGDLAPSQRWLRQRPRFRKGRCSCLRRRTLSIGGKGSLCVDVERGHARPPARLTPAIPMRWRALGRSTQGRRTKASWKGGINDAPRRCSRIRRFSRDVRCGDSRVGGHHHVHLCDVLRTGAGWTSIAAVRSFQRASAARARCCRSVRRPRRSSSVRAVAARATLERSRSTSGNSS